MPDLAPIMWFSGIYQPTANTTTATMVVSTSPLRRVGSTSRVVNIHHCPNVEGFGLAAAKAVVTTTSVAGRACSRATPVLMAMRSAMGSELLGEGPVALPAVTRSVAVELERAPPEVTRSVPVELERAPPEVTRSVPVELERAPPEVTRSVPQWLRQPPGGEDSQAAHLQTRAVAASWPKASQTARRVGPASATAQRAG